MMSKAAPELACDMAETYGVIDLSELPVRTLAALAVGLRGNSRTIQKLSGTKLDTTTALLALIADHMRVWTWRLFGGPRPESLLSKLLGENDSDKESGVVSYATGEEFMAAREAWMREGANNVD